MKFAQESKKALLILLFIIIYVGTASSQNVADKYINRDSMAMEAMKTKQANIAAAASSTIQYFVMKNEDNTYGYSIFINGNMTYHQPNIPAVNGSIGFAKVEHADACAKLAIQKIKEGASPPTLSVEEVEKIVKSK